MTKCQQYFVTDPSRSVDFQRQETDPAPANDTWHDSAQHTEPAERQRFRRTEKIVDR